LWRYVGVDGVQIGVKSGVSVLDQDGQTFDCVVVSEFRYGARDRVVNQHLQSAALFRRTAGTSSVFQVDGVIVEFRVFGSGGEFYFNYCDNVNGVSV
jgi:uncharacterized membrane protein YbhN (UPF0104 family)